MTEHIHDSDKKTRRGWGASRANLYTDCIPKELTQAIFLQGQEFLKPDDKEKLLQQVE